MSKKQESNMGGDMGGDILIEHFTVREDQGAVALMVGLQKPGYTMEKIDRNGTKVEVNFRKNNAENDNGSTKPKGQYRSKKAKTVDLTKTTVWKRTKKV